MKYTAPLLGRVCVAPPRPGVIDVVLLCTKGIYDVMSNWQMAAVLAGRSEVAATADALIAGAQARGAPDDVTCACVLLRRRAGREPDGG